MKYCYECGRAVSWLAGDGRCKDCTRLTPEEVGGALKWVLAVIVVVLLPSLSWSAEYHLQGSSYNGVALAPNTVYSFTVSMSDGDNVADVYDHGISVGRVYSGWGPASMGFIADRNGNVVIDVSCPNCSYPPVVDFVSNTDMWGLAVDPSAFSAMNGIFGSDVLGSSNGSAVGYDVPVSTAGQTDVTGMSGVFGVVVGNAGGSSGSIAGIFGAVGIADLGGYVVAMLVLLLGVALLYVGYRYARKSL